VAVRYLLQNSGSYLGVSGRKQPRRGNNVTSKSLGRPPQLAASFISNQVCDVGYWHLTDNPVALAFVRFWTTADNGGSRPAMVCPLMTNVTFLTI